MMPKKKKKKNDRVLEDIQNSLKNLNFCSKPVSPGSHLVFTTHNLNLRAAFLPH